jgi:dipeptidyl aminopeptidase/acylaminoacyl peptidase
MSQDRKQTRPYGSWPTELSADRILAGALRLGRPQLDRGWLYWLEGRPSEGGRQVVVRSRPGVEPADVSPADQNVRTLVHEYGGGEYRVRGGRLVHADMVSGSIWLRDVEDPSSGRQLTDDSRRYADFEFSPDGAWIAAVEERAQAEGEPQNRIVVFRLDETDGLPTARVVAEAHDFVSFPRFSPDGSKLVYTAWEHPNMPWDGTRLFVIGFGDGGPEGEPRCVAGGDDESIFQPGFSPDGRLTWVSDHSGWWNLTRLEVNGTVRSLRPKEAEFGRPQWVFGMSTWAYVDADTILCSVSHDGFDRLCRLELHTGLLVDLELPYSNAVGLEVENEDGGRVACFVAGGPERATAICRLDLSTNCVEELRLSFDLALPDGGISRPEPIEFETGNGLTAHAFFYPPANPQVDGPSDERPPLLVKGHGGPTSATVPVLNLSIQYWTSRGFAVVDVNYGGSSGYGRAYRQRLRGQWGVVDVEDCVNAARYLVDAGRVDGARLAISGGSAGGYTVLCALTFHDVFGAGASHYGIGDLEALARDTHKFESRYTDGLVGVYPDEIELYRERSPIHFTEQLSCPVIFFQGLEDKVVPPNQAEAMVEALARRGIDHAYVTFPGEQHGFRRSENIRKALEGELYFYSRIFGFETDVHPEGVEILD